MKIKLPLKFYLMWDCDGGLQTGLCVADTEIEIEIPERVRHLAKETKTRIAVFPKSMVMIENFESPELRPD